MVSYGDIVDRGQSDKGESVPPVATERSSRCCFRLGIYIPLLYVR
jgi:hypothetical protein